MSDWILIWLAGTLGSAHCIGMCGGFAAALGAAATHRWSNLARQTSYSAGRIFTYCFGGAVAGYGGFRLSQQTSAVVNTQALLAIAAGLFLVWEGLRSAGLIRRRGATGPACLAGSLFAPWLRSPSLGGVFLGGVFTGFLPCGLVYGFLALAASRQNLAAGAATMLAFGLGTVPAMVLTGMAAPAAVRSRWGQRYRRQVWQLAAWCVVATGLVSVSRGVGFLRLPSGPVGAGCPGCQNTAGDVAWKWPR